MKAQRIHTPHPVRLAAVVALAIAAATTAVAAPPDVKSIISQMKQALEPSPSSLRKMTLTLAQGGTTNSVTLGQARGKAGGKNHILTVLLAPADLRGMAYLVREEPASNSDMLWTWLPAIGRVRTVVSPEAFSAVLNSDFTYSDLGFVTLRSTATLKGEETVGGVKAYRIEEIPAQNWYYARIVTLVAADTFLPIERDFFDPANQPWKVERFSGLATIDGVPTVLKIDMEDTQYKSHSTLAVTDLRYKVDVPETLLQPDQLPKAAAAPIWTSFSAPVGK